MHHEYDSLVQRTSDYTGIRTSHVFKQGIKPGSTAWKSRASTTQPATHIILHKMLTNLSLTIIHYADDIYMLDSNLSPNS